MKHSHLHLRVCKGRYGCGALRQVFVQDIVAIVEEQRVYEEWAKVLEEELSEIVGKESQCERGEDVCR